MSWLALAAVATLLTVSGCRSAASQGKAASPAELLAGAEAVGAVDCPENWGADSLTCVAWVAPGGGKYVSVHDPDGRPVRVLVRAADGTFEVAWEAGNDV